jgi:DNA ligase-1
MRAFAETAAAIAATAAKSEKIALLATYLRTLDGENLAAASRFFTGRPFAPTEDRTLSVGGRTLVAAATAAWNVDPAALRERYRETGDLGAALAPFVQPPLDLGLFRETLTPASLKARLDAIADAAGPSAGRTRQILCERILGACSDASEATYAIKIVTGDLRIGLKAGLVVDAIALAFGREPDAVRRAAAAAGDIGAVALAAKNDRLADIALAYFVPIAAMLATPIAFGSSYSELADGAWIVEEKYDGVRMQAHCDPARIALFSRTQSESGAAFPEIVAALAHLGQRCMLDGEIVAERDGRVLPFRALQPRLQRKDVTAELQADIPVRYMVFDLLALGDEPLLDRPLAERRGRLAEVLADADERIMVAPWSALETGAEPVTIERRFAEARERGHEGIVFKRSDAPYAAGRRGKWWLKLKRELATLDCVVTAVEWGHGRRAKVLSDYTFAVRAPDGSLATIGKAYSGLTDAEIAEMTTWFLAHQSGTQGRTLTVDPQIVVEIAFDILQPSARHASGYALRFPRIVRLRPDKAARDADTLDRVGEIYREMLAREGRPLAISAGRIAWRGRRGCARSDRTSRWCWPSCGWRNAIGAARPGARR